MRDELHDRYGVLPEPVLALLEVADFRSKVREYGVSEVSLQGRSVRISPVVLADSQQLRLSRLYPGSVYKSAVRTLSIPRRVADGEPLRDQGLLVWVTDLLAAVLPVVVGAMDRKVPPSR